MLMDCETAGTCVGERVGDAEPFCGRFSAKNPWAVYFKGGEEEGYYLDSSSSTVSSAPLAYLTWSCIHVNSAVWQSCSASSDVDSAVLPDRRVALQMTQILL